MSWSFHNNRNQTETVYFLNKNGLDQEQCYKPTPPRLGRETQEDHKCEDSLYCLIKTFQKSQKQTNLVQGHGASTCWVQSEPHGSWNQNYQNGGKKRVLDSQGVRYWDQDFSVITSTSHKD